MRLDLLTGQHGARVRAPAGVAHARRVVADDQHDDVTQVLELAELLQHDRVAEMDVRRRRVEAQLHAQRASVLRDRLAGAARAPRREATQQRCAPGKRPGTRDRNRRKASAPMLESGTPSGRLMRVIADSRTPLPLGVRRRLRPLRATMSDDDQPDIPPSPVDADALPEDPFEPPPPAGRPRVRKRRLLLAVLPLALLAIVSTIFGMMMALARELPNLETAREFQSARNSVLVDRRGEPLGILASDRNRVLIPYRDISSVMRNAIISIEDQRFYENSGRRRARHRPRLRRGRRQGRLAPGRLDDRPAVREERARGAVQPHGLPEAARVGARLPPDPALVEEQDPHRVPQLDLLRQRRVRHRVRGAGLLRRPTRTTSAAGRPTPARARRS